MINKYREAGAERAKDFPWVVEPAKQAVIRAIVAHGNKEGMAVPARIAVEEILGLLDPVLLGKQEELSE